MKGLSENTVRRRTAQDNKDTSLDSSATLLLELFERLSGGDSWMPHGVLPASARATYRSVVCPPEFEREIPLARPGEIQK